MPPSRAYRPKKIADERSTRSNAISHTSVSSVTPALRVATPGAKSKRYILLGLGTYDADKPVDSPTLMKIGAAVSASCHDEKRAASASVLLPGDRLGPSLYRDFATAFYSGLYADNRYRTGKKVELRAEDVKTVRLAVEGDDAAGAAADIAAGMNVAAGCSLTKDIVNAPHNVLNSESLADTARRIAEESGGCITAEILGKKECEARGMVRALGCARFGERKRGSD